MLDQEKIKSAEKAFYRFDKIVGRLILIALIIITAWLAYTILSELNYTGPKLWGLSVIIGVIGGWLIKQVLRVVSWFS